MILRSKKQIEPKTVVSKSDEKSKLNAFNTKEAELKANESFNLQNF